MKNLLNELKEKREETLKVQEELIQLSNEKSKELLKIVKHRLSEHLNTDKINLFVSLDSRTLSREWNPMIGIKEIDGLLFYDYFEKTRDHIIREYSGKLNWKLLFETCDKLSSELGIPVIVSKHDLFLYKK